MALITTIFALVFLTELISWIGKSVLLEFVRIAIVLARPSPYSFHRPNINFGIYLCVPRPMRFTCAYSIPPKLHSRRTSSQKFSRTDYYSPGKRLVDEPTRGANLCLRVVFTAQ